MKITIKLIGADGRFTASIDQLLKLRTQGHYALAEHGDIVMIDADSIDGKKALDHTTLDDQTIILTVTPKQFSDYTYVVQKPIKVDDILSVLESITQHLKRRVITEITPEEAPKKVKPQESGNPFAKFMDPEYLAKHQASNRYLKGNGAADILIEEVEALNDTFAHWKPILEETKQLIQYDYNDCFPDQEDGESLAVPHLYGDLESNFYDMSNYASYDFISRLYTDFIKGIYYFQYGDGHAFLFSDDFILSSLSADRILGFSKVQKNDVTVLAIGSKAQFLNLMAQSERYYYGDAMSILSRAILLEANGRIINRKDITEPLGLMKAKGSFQTTIDIPGSEEMDNIWQFRNVSLRETAELLTEVNPHHIFSYYTLCYLYGSFDREASEKKSRNHLDLNALLSELQKL